MNNQYIELLADNLRLVWNEKDPGVRLKAIEQIYATDANLYHVGHKVTGHEEINNSITTVLKNLPPAFRFTLSKPIIINNDIGRAIWGAGPDGQPVLSTGMDIARFEDGRIKSLYVFLEN